MSCNNSTNQPLENAINRCIERIGTVSDEKIEKIQKNYTLIVTELLNKIKSTKNTDIPLVIGIDAHQGAGKSTLINLLIDYFESIGETVVGFSIDDFYKPYQQLEEVKRSVISGSQFSDSLLFNHRGNVGTHDDTLLYDCMKRMKDFKDTDESVIIPQFDKALRNGKGDRLPEGLKINSKPSIILVDGWNIGHENLSEDDLKKNINEFKQILETDPKYFGTLTFTERDLNCLDFEATSLNNYLANESRKKWINMIELWIVMHPNDHRATLKWRTEAEKKMILKTGKGMSDDELAIFMKCYIPSYYIFGKDDTKLLNKTNKSPNNIPTIYIELDEGRSISNIVTL